MYKTKIDSFINYNFFNNTIDKDSKSDSPNNEGLKSTISSSSEKYNRIAENFISQIKMSQDDVLNNKKTDLDIQYEIVSNPEIVMENLTNRVNELEEMMSNLERSIGNWNIVTILFA